MTLNKLYLTRAKTIIRDLIEAEKAGHVTITEEKNGVKITWQNNVTSPLHTMTFERVIPYSVFEQMTEPTVISKIFLQQFKEELSYGVQGMDTTEEGEDTGPESNEEGEDTEPESNEELEGE